MTLSKALKGLLPIFSVCVLSVCNIANAKHAEYDYVVVGAGAAGLSAAFTLHQSMKTILSLRKTVELVGLQRMAAEATFIMRRGQST